MAGPMFTGDPFGGEGTVELADGTQYPAFLEEFTQGQLRVENGVIFNNQTGRIMTNVSRQAPFTLEGLEGGFYNLVKLRNYDQLNSADDIYGMRTVSGTISAQRSDGTVQTFEVQGVPINRAGYQWATYPTETGGVGYLRVEAKYNTNEELRQGLNNAALSLATPDQAAAQGIYYRLLHDQLNELEDFASDHGLTKPDGSPDTYAALAQIMAIGNLSDLLAFTQQILQP